MYYIEEKDSDSIELMNALSEEQVIDHARNLANTTEIYSLSEAIKVLNENNYTLFEDC